MAEVKGSGNCTGQKDRKERGEEHERDSVFASWNTDILHPLLFINPYLQPACKYNKRIQPGHKFYRFLLNTWTGIALPLDGVRLAVSGLEKIPSGKNFLVVGNQRSNFDPINTWYVLRKYPIANIFKEENFQIPFFGRINEGYPTFDWGLSGRHTKPDRGTPFALP